MNIKGNNHYIPLLHWDELTEKQKGEFDYAGAEDSVFFQYKGRTYDLGDFMRPDQHAPAWLQEYDGFMNDSFFSGILVKMPDDEYHGDYIKVYTFTS